MSVIGSKSMNYSSLVQGMEDFLFKTSVEALEIKLMMQ